MPSAGFDNGESCQRAERPARIIVAGLQVDLHDLAATTVA
jgi:hypothetical protein